MAQQLRMWNLPRVGDGIQRYDESAMITADGEIIPIEEAIAGLPWITQQCPVMPHQYIVKRDCNPLYYAALDAMIMDSPESFVAYWRGYKSPNRYWPGPNGFRYWRTGAKRPGQPVTLMLNRTDAVDDTRRVDEGGRVEKDWHGPPWAPNNSGIYERGRDGRWWPTQAALESGFRPCRGCRR